MLEMVRMLGYMAGKIEELHEGSWASFVVW